MRRSPRLLFGSALAGPIVLALAWALASTSCATYRQDLERARAHYAANEYEKALALMRVLEYDMDSFSEAEKTQYAYTRGMTDYRLASLATPGTSVVDPRKGFRDNSRHWLAVAAAIEKKTPGGLSQDEKQRLNEALTDLNRDVYGGGEALADVDGGPPAAPGAVPPGGLTAPGAAAPAGMTAPGGAAGPPAVAVPPGGPAPGGAPPPGGSGFQSPGTSKP